MSSRIRLARLAGCGMVALLMHADVSEAREAYWRGTVSSDWNSAGNWFVVGAPGDGSFVPQVAGGINARAIIGTDNPNGALNSNDAPFGSPVISGTLTPVEKETVGGLYLGLRERDFLVSPPALVNPAPAPGALVGALTINAGTLNNISTTEADRGADGRIVVGADGRGYLTMNGGTLTGLALVVAGENITTDTGAPNELGPSHVDLRGNATMTIANPANPGSATATFERRLSVTGPDVNFSATGNIRLTATNTFTANISGASHSPLRTDGNVQLGGDLAVNYSGPPPPMGQTWNLFDFAGALTGNFNNLGIGGDVTVAGAPEPVAGEVYRLRQVEGGTKGNLYQLVHDSVLVLQVDRNTGEMSITNPVNHQVIGIDGYMVESRTAGSLVASGFHGISGASPPPDAGWQKPPSEMLTSSFLGELRAAEGVFDQAIGSSLPLGDSFRPKETAVGLDPANFGIHPEDLVFHYTFPGAPGGWVRGQVEYVGDTFDNNLVLRVNPATGDAELVNDTLHDLSFDGYTVLSSTGALSDANWIGIGGDWQKSPGSESSLTETNLIGDVTLAAGASVSLGQIGNFSDAADQEGLSIEFIRTKVPGVGSPAGDFNDDGVVDVADYEVWKANFGAPLGDNGGIFDAAAYTVWRDTVSAVAIGDEETFRVGMVRFDAGAGGGSMAAVASVPEPGTTWLLLVGLGAVAVLGRKRSRRTSCPTTQYSEAPAMSVQRGGFTMSVRSGFAVSAAMSVGAALLVALPAGAQMQTQGIPLVNWDFNQPGGGKVVPFDANGDFVPGLIPGWTFSGPGTEVRFNPTDPDTMEPLILGDSSTEPGGSTLRPDPGNHLTLADPDGTVYQTVSPGDFSIGQIDNNKAYRVTFDANDFFTIDDADPNPMQFTGRAQFQASIYYETVGGDRVALGTQSWNPPQGGWFRYELEVPGPVPTAALGRPIGVEFDVTSVEFNQGTEFNVAHSWIGFDNVLMEVAGLLSLPGDLNGDGFVNDADYAIVRDNQQQACLWLACGDVTRDGLVNLNDFRAFKALHAAAGAGAIVGHAGSVPEPSTLALVFLAAVLSGSMIRRKRGTWNRMRRGLLTAVGISVLTGSASTSFAELLYYDPFLIGANPNAGEYVASSEEQFVGLAGQNPVMNFPGGGSDPTFFSGPWETPDVGQSGGIVHSDSISYLGTPSLGGSARVAPVPDPQNPGEFLTFNGRTGRHLSNPWTSATEGTYYLSFLANFGTTTGGMGYRSVEFWPVGNVIGQDAGRMDIGYNEFFGYGVPGQTNPNTARMAVNFAGQHVILEGAPPSYNEDGLNHLIIFKFELSAEDNDDTISIFLNPTTADEPEVADGRISNVNFTLTAMGHMSHFGGGTSGIFDELRVGTEFESVLPELPCAGGTRGQVLPACAPGIDLEDFETILANFGRTDAVGPHEGDVAGTNGRIGNDGRVDLRDFRLWKDNRTDLGTGSLAGFAVPEPSSGILALAALLAFCGYLRPARERAPKKC